MDKLQKFDYTQRVESYLEQHQVYELFEDLLKQLVVKRPEDPHSYLLNVLQHAQLRRFFLIGLPGTNSKENAQMLAKEFQLTPILVGDLLRKEVVKKTDRGQKIDQSFKNHKLVDDEIVIQIVNEHIVQSERLKKSWIVQGFPRTKVQALSLQKNQIIPDKVISLQRDEEKCLNHLRQMATKQGEIYDKKHDELALKIYQECDLNLRAVHETFNQFVYFYDTSSCEHATDTGNDLVRMMKIKFRSNAPRRPPQVILIGGPGSGRSTQAEILAKRFGLVNVSPQKLLQAESQKNPAIKIKIQQAQESGVDVPDDILLRVIDSRLSQSDCHVNGWILDGFPQTETQINLMQTIQIRPSLVCLLQQTCDETVNRLSKRRVDPMTGKYYNLDKELPENEVVRMRLVTQKQDETETVKARFASFSGQLTGLEEAFKEKLLQVAADQEIEQVADQISEAIQNPI